METKPHEISPTECAADASLAPRTVADGRGTRVPDTPIPCALQEKKEKKGTKRKAEVEPLPPSATEKEEKAAKKKARFPTAPFPYTELFI